MQSGYKAENSIYGYGYLRARRGKDDYVQLNMATGAVIVSTEETTRHETAYTEDGKVLRVEEPQSVTPGREHVSILIYPDGRRIMIDLIRRTITTIKRCSESEKDTPGAFDLEDGCRYLAIKEEGIVFRSYGKE